MTMGIMKKERNQKLIATIFTCLILALLIISGPANAFIINLNGFAISNPSQGDKISTTASVEINSNEQMPLPNPFEIFVDDNLIRTFSVDATSTDCDDAKGINISLISNTNSYGYGYGYRYGYGYGYGYQSGYNNGIFTYNVTLDTNKFTLGEHEIQLRIDAGDNHIYSSEEKLITINPVGANNTETQTSVTSDEDAEFDNSSVIIEYNGTENARITVSGFSSRPTDTNTFSIPELNKYYQIETNVSDIGETLIRIYYTDAEVSSAGLTESNLRIYFYNSTSENWENPLDSGVNTIDNYVWALTDHFSVWGVFGTAVTTTTIARSSTTENYYGARNLITKKETPINLINTQNSPEETEETPELKGTLSRITGAVIGGVTSTAGIITIVFIVGIAGTWGVARTLRKRNVNKLSKKGMANLILSVLMVLLVLDSLFLYYLI